MVGIVALALLALMVFKTKARKVLIVGGLVVLAIHFPFFFVFLILFVDFYINLEIII